MADIDVKELRRRAHDHKWLPNERRWSCEDDIKALCDALDAAERERDEARDWVRRMHRDSQVLTCVYCGHAYPPGTPASGSDVLTEHIKVCEKHPIRAAERRADEAHRTGMLRAAEICGAYFDERKAAEIDADDDADKCAAHEDARVALHLSEAIQAEATEKGQSDV